MGKLSDGARQLPLHHLSVRVPWHDRAWDGSVCQDPQGNSACLALRRISQNKDENREHAIRSKPWQEMKEDAWPACAVERAAFMSSREWIRNVKHPYAESSPAHKHFDETPLRHRPYSANCIPFAWMLKGGAEQKTELLDLDFDVAAEEAVHEVMGFSTNWVQAKQNQLALLDTFFSAIHRGDSLCFLYAKDTPLSNDPRRVIVGVGRVKGVDGTVEYKYKWPAPHKAVVWDRIVQHSIRPDFKDGFLFPYHQVLKLADNDSSVEPGRFVAFAPEECWEQFSYATEHVTHDAAVAALLSCAEALRRIADVVPGDWHRQLEWLDGELNRLWRLRGPFPGLGSALKALGIPAGNLIAYDLAKSQTDVAAEWTESPWQLVDQVMENPSLLAADLGRHLSPTVRRLYKGLPKPRRSLLQLISRFDVSETQATRFYQETERQKAGLVVTDAELLENPYRLYEGDRHSPDPIPIGVVDRGMCPDPIVASKHPLPAPSVLEGELDPRRVRAHVVADLEQAATDGHTLKARNDVVQAIRDSELRPPCPVGLDAMSVIEEHLPPEVAIAKMADGSVAYQLARLAAVGAIIRSDVVKRIGGKRHEAKVEWRKLVDQALPGPVDSEEEELARQEKVAALQELFCSRLSVLVGPAGTGKTTLLKVLCAQPTVKQGGILLLAPTGKARVRMETQIGISGAKTIAQFLLKRKRYDPRTNRYHVSDFDKADVAQTVIIDEASMLTEDQLGAVIDAIRPPGRLVLVGDPRQLPPIGTGRPFVDIVSKLAPPAGERKFPFAAPGYAELTIRRRQKGESRPDLTLAEWFSGRVPGPDADSVWDELAKGGASPFLKLVRWDSEEDIENRLLEELCTELELGGDDDEAKFETSLGGQPFGSAVYFNLKVDSADSPAAKVESWQILSPVRGGAPGVERLNKSIQQRFRRRVLSWAAPKQGWDRKTAKPAGRYGILYGDKVISVVNGPRKDVYPKQAEDGYVANGEIGIVVGQYKGQKWPYGKKLPWKVEVEFASQRGLKYGYHGWDFGEEGRESLELAYALTVHKSQGSEFERVFLIVPNPCRLLSPELLYTALTRQQKRIIVLHQGPLADLKNYSQGHYSETARRLTNLFEAPSPIKIETRYLEARLIHKTRRGEAVRSKSEVVIADLLYALGVDYRYEKEFVGEDGARRLPDFTVDDPASGLKVFWEHLGMLERPQYRKDWEKKLAWYRQQGVLPDNEGGGPNGTLVTSRDDERGGIDSQQIEAVARKVFGLGV